MGLAGQLDGMSPSEMALRFAANCVGVSSVIVGTRNLAHFEENVRLMAKGKLPDATLAQIHATFAHHDQNWAGII
jgi:aryl-alcohol dehydrogenase-like predicted oxidoreductase